MAEYIYEYKYGDGYASAGVKQKLVRCKDCMFWNRYDDVQVIGSCRRHGDIYNKRETDFCSWGEQKDEVKENGR